MFMEQNNPKYIYVSVLRFTINLMCLTLHFFKEGTFIQLF